MAASTTSHFEHSAHCHVHMRFIPPFYDNSTLRAFYTPSESEVLAIQHNLFEPSAELAALTTKIATMKSLLQILENRHNRLNIPVTRTRQFIAASPIRRLPSEVLCMIFFYSCHTPVPGGAMRYGFPFTLAVVCSHWRAILLKTPVLWNVIHLGPKKNSPAIVDRQLDLSGSLPLSLLIEGPLDGRPFAGIHNIYEETDEYYKAVLNRIFRALPRWQDICIQIEHLELPYFESLLERAIQPVNLQGQDNNDFGSPIILPDLLQAVILKVRHLHQDASIHLPEVFESAPRFKTFSLFNRDGRPLNIHDFWPSRGLPWRQLKTVNLEHEALDVLGQLPADFFSNGKEAEVGIYLQHSPSYDVSHQPTTLIRSRNFTSLKLVPNRWAPSCELPRYLEALYAPTLEHVEVGCAMHPYERWRQTSDGRNDIGCQNILSALYAAIWRSRCMIKSFTFYVFYDAPDKAFDDSFARAIIELLYVMPELETLEIREAAKRGPSLLSDPEFFHLCGAVEMGGVLPKLKSLKLVWAADRQPPIDELVPMLQSRIGDSTLRSVVIGVRKGGDLERQVVDCLRQLGENGIRATQW